MDEKETFEKQALDYAKGRIEKELKDFYNETVGAIFPSIFGDLPIAIIKAVVDDDKFWKETIFIGIGNYVRSKKQPIIEILNFLESDTFKALNYGLDHTTKGKPSFTVGENMVRQLLAGSISDSEKDDFIAEPITFLRNWLKSEDSISILPSDDVKHSIENIFLGILMLVALFLIVYVIITKPKLDIGPTTKLIIENIFNNVKYNQKTKTGGLIKSIINVTDTFVRGDEKGKLLKNTYILINELNKVAKSVNYLNTSLANEFTETELQAKKFKVKNKFINKELEDFNKIIGQNAKKITGNLIKKGGLWEGKMMEYIFADLIYARVHVTFEGDKTIFKKREGKDIIDWTDEESRKQHPLSKEVKKFNSLSNEQVGQSIEYNIAEYLFGYFKHDSSNIIVQEAFLLKDLAQKKLFKELKQLGTSSKKIINYKKQINAIIKDFNFKEFNITFGIDFVVSGSNITSGQPVYFNHKLTPTMPVIKAVRISSNFPFLFQPILLKHSEEDVKPKINYAINETANTWVKNKDLYYKKHYSGYFIDGGLLNNFPMNAFNPKIEGGSFRDPKSILDLPPNNKVLGLKLGGMEVRKPKSQFKNKKFLGVKIGESDIIKSSTLQKEFDTLIKNAAEGEDKRLDHYSHDEGTGIQTLNKLKSPKFDINNYQFLHSDESTYDSFIKNTTNKSGKDKDEKIGFLTLIMKMYGATMDNSMDGRNSAFYDKNEQIIRLYTGGVSLFDLVTRDKELALVDLFSYSLIFKHFNLLDSLKENWEIEVIKRLKRNTYLKKKWKRETKDRNRLK